MKLYYEQYSDEYNKVQSEWKKQRSFTIKTSGYHAYFGLSATSLSQDSEFEVDDGATKLRLRLHLLSLLRLRN